MARRFRAKNLSVRVRRPPRGQHKPCIITVPVCLSPTCVGGSICDAPSCDENTGCPNGSFGCGCSRVGTALTAVFDPESYAQDLEILRLELQDAIKLVDEFKKKIAGGGARKPRGKPRRKPRKKT